MVNPPVTWRLRSAFFSILLIVALPVIALLLAQRLWTRRKGLVGVREKLTGRGAPMASGQILVHGVSLGEVNLMRPLIPRLEQALGARCLLTTTTETGRARLDEVFADHDRAFLPFDLPWAVTRFLARTRPRLVVLLELEVWPLFLCACFARGIPVVLLNARVSERSFRGYRRAGALLRPLFAGLALAFGQNGAWSARLAALGVARERLIAGGSMKADMVARADAAAMTREAARLGLRAGQPVLLLASTSAGPVVEEELLLVRQHAKWRARGWRIVICPRHPERGGEIQELLARIADAKTGLSVRRSSQGQAIDADDQALIVDEIGKLAALYAWTAQVGGIALVGGSLGSGRGGQNMLEAAAAGCCTVVGWDTRNFPDAMALLRAEGGVLELAPATLHEELEALALDPVRRAQIGERGQRAWRRGQGATERAVAAVATFAAR